MSADYVRRDDDQEDRGRDRINNDDRDGGYSNRRDDDERGDDKFGNRGRARVYFRKKICKFCKQNYPMDYKNAEALHRFITDRGKILPRRITGTCAKHQRLLSVQIKRARTLALLPFVKQ